MYAMFEIMVEGLENELEVGARRVAAGCSVALTDQLKGAIGGEHRMQKARVLEKPDTKG